MSFKNKYLKYKSKYLSLKREANKVKNNQSGGSNTIFNIDVLTNTPTMHKSKVSLNLENGINNLNINNISELITNQKSSGLIGGHKTSNVLDDSDFDSSSNLNSSSNSDSDLFSSSSLSDLSNTPNHI